MQFGTLKPETLKIGQAKISLTIFGDLIWIFGDLIWKSVCMAQFGVLAHLILCMTKCEGSGKIPTEYKSSLLLAQIQWAVFRVGASSVY